MKPQSIIVDKKEKGLVYLKMLLMFSISTYHLDFGTSVAMEHNVKRLCDGGFYTQRTFKTAIAKPVL